MVLRCERVRVKCRGVEAQMDRDDPSTPPDRLGADLLSIVNGTHPKGRWIRWGMIGSTLVIGFFSSRMGWRPYRLQLVLIISAVWFVIALGVAIIDRANR